MLDHPFPVTTTTGSKCGRAVPSGSVSSRMASDGAWLVSTTTLKSGSDKSNLNKRGDYAFNGVSERNSVKHQVMKLLASKKLALSSNNKQLMIQQITYRSQSCLLGPAACVRPLSTSSCRTAEACPAPFSGLLLRTPSRVRCAPCKRPEKVG